ncbi:MAG: triose-phosphate isomerase [Pseudomonadota bacterium]|nr:triose-phosphate isomerase [Pseudomonadota bacterium]
MPKRRRLVIGNWKMYGRLTSGLQLARDLFEKAEQSKPLKFDVVVCPPATIVWPVAEALMGSHIALGAQDCHTATHGAYTGDVSAAMFADLGCRYVILGHSERRLAHGETNELVAQKVTAAQLAGLTTIVCVGETAEQLSSGEGPAIIEKQLKASLPEKCRMANLVVAYEPVWAIGTGQQPPPPDIANVHRLIRQTLGTVGETVRVIYGGSVSPVNAELIAAEDEVDGFLVGSASINVDGFWAIAEKCE